jgi:chromosome segregation ATPase
VCYSVVITLFKESERAKIVEEIANKTKTEMDNLNQLYDRECSKVEKLKNFVCEQEKQCDELASHIKMLTKDRDAWMERAEQRGNEIKELRQKTTTTESKLSETNRLRDELNRFKDKASFLEVC